MSEQAKPAVEGKVLKGNNPIDCLTFFNEHLRDLKDKDGRFHEFRLEAAGTIAKLISENEALKKELSILKETPKAE